MIQHPLHKYNHREFAFVQNYQKWEKWIKGKIINSWWVLINRCDGIIYQRHVNQLRHNRKVSHEKGEEMGQSDKQYNDRYEGINRDMLSGFNENIKEQFNNENALKPDQSQFLHVIVIGMVVNKDW